MIFKYKDYTTQDLSHLLLDQDMYPARLCISFSGKKDDATIQFRADSELAYEVINEWHFMDFMESARVFRKINEKLAELIIKIEE